MAKASFIPWSGLAAILTGLLGIGGAILGENPNPAYAWVFVLANVVTYVALIGILLFQRPEAGLWGWLGFGAAMVGNTLFFFESILAVAGGIYAVGLILLAIGVLRAGKLPRWVAYLWILAPLVGLPGFLIEGFSGLFFVLGSLAYSLAFIAAGYRMWQAPETMAAAA